EVRLAVIDRWIERLESGLGDLEARRAQGDAAPYDVRRIERELEIAAAERAVESAALSSAWTELETWTRWKDRPPLQGDLAPPRSTGADMALPELARIEQMERALAAEEDAWGAPFLRGWVVGAGYRLAHAGDAIGHGFVLSLSVPLAFWNTDQPRLDRLAAQQTELRAERALETSTAQSSADAARQELEQTLDTLDRLSDPARDEELTQMARAAYGAGEATLTELLDAFQSEAELQLARIDLEWAARQAALDLDRRLGIGVPE